MLGGGKFTYFDKIIPGTYDRYITLSAPETQETTGITAGAVEMDWGPENQVFSITATQFNTDAEKYTGYTFDAPENLLLREVFKHATTLIGYRVNSGGKKAQATAIGQAKYSGAVGNKITVSVLHNINDEEKYDITTYFDGIAREIQTVPTANRDEIALTKGTEKSGTAVETADASFTFKDNQITVQFSNVPEGYKPSIRIKGQVGILAWTPGRMEDMELSNGNKHIVSYYPGAPINGEMTIEAVLTKDKITVLKSCTYTCKLNEAVETGADLSALKDNDFVTFNKTGLAQENAGYVFTGGNTKSTTTVQNHVDALNALEPYFFNALYCDSTDDTVKALYVSHTKRMREEKGKHFLTYVYDYAADYEAVVSVKNAAVNSPKASNLVYWSAGFSSAMDLSREMTNQPYDGELEIDTSYPEVTLQMLFQQGQFLFHYIALDDLRTFVDVNTLQSFTSEHDKILSNNKVIRIIDYVHNAIVSKVNSDTIGNYVNDAEDRTSLWNYVCDLLKGLWKSRALKSFDSSDVIVYPVEGDDEAVAIDQVYDVTGTIRKVYLTSYIGKNNQ